MKLILLLLVFTVALRGQEGTGGLLTSVSCGTLPGCKFVPISISNIAANTDTDFLKVGGTTYTPPAGRRFMIGWYGMWHSAGTSVCYMTWKHSGTYYRIHGNTTVSASFSTTIVNPPFILEAGDSFGMNCSISTANIWAPGVEFDVTSTSPFTKYVINMANSSPTGNTIYTVSPGMVAGPLLWVPVGSVQNCNYSNLSGAGRTVYLYFVPNGGSLGSTNLVANGIVVSNNALANFTGALAGNAGDFIQVVVDSTATNQLAWCSFQEVPQ